MGGNQWVGKRQPSFMTTLKKKVQKQQIYKKHGTVLPANGDNGLSHSCIGTGGWKSKNVQKQQTI